MNPGASQRRAIVMDSSRLGKMIKILEDQKRQLY